MVRAIDTSGTRVRLRLNPNVGCEQAAVARSLLEIEIWGRQASKKGWRMEGVELTRRPSMLRKEARLSLNRSMLNSRSFTNTQSDISAVERDGLSIGKSEKRGRSATGRVDGERGVGGCDQIESHRERRPDHLRRGNVGRKGSGWLERGGFHV